MKKFLQNAMSIIFFVVVVVLLPILSWVCRLSIPVFVVFLILKIANVIAWEWWIVWLPVIVGAISFILYLVIFIANEIL